MNGGGGDGLWRSSWLSSAVPSPWPLASGSDGFHYRAHEWMVAQLRCVWRHQVHGRARTHTHSVKGRNVLGSRPSQLRASPPFLGQLLLCRRRRRRLSRIPRRAAVAKIGTFRLLRLGLRAAADTMIAHDDRMAAGTQCAADETTNYFSSRKLVDGNSAPILERRPGEQVRRRREHLLLPPLGALTSFEGALLLPRRRRRR